MCHSVHHTRCPENTRGCCHCWRWCKWSRCVPCRWREVHSVHLSSSLLKVGQGLCLIFKVPLSWVFFFNWRREYSQKGRFSGISPWNFEKKGKGKGTVMAWCRTPIPGPVLTQIYVAIRLLLLGNNELTHWVWGCVYAPGPYSDVIMGTTASEITSLTIVFSTVYSDADQRKHQSSASLAFVRGIHRGPVNSPHKWRIRRKMFPFDDVIMEMCHHWRVAYSKPSHYFTKHRRIVNLT